MTQTLNTIDMTPDVSLLKKTGKTGYTTPWAIGEFVDNAIDARVGKVVHIDVRVKRTKEGPRIIVADDASGMDRQQLQEALVMARSKKAGEQIGRFGMGMKTAAATLGKSFSVTTKTTGSKRALRVVYNEDQFIAGGRWALPIEEANWEGDGTHGTIIEVWDLNVSAYGGLEDTIRESLGGIFRHFIEKGFCAVTVGKHVAKPVYPDILPGYRKEFNFDLNGRRVYGWVGISPEHRSRDYGIDLIRHNRVMRENDKLGWNPHPSLGYIRGELHLDDFETNFSKTDFDRNSADWTALVDRLKKEFADVVAQSRKMAASKAVSESVKAAAYDKTNLVQQAINSPDFIDNVLPELANEADLAEGMVGFDYNSDGTVETEELEEVTIEKRAPGMTTGTVEPVGTSQTRTGKQPERRAKTAKLVVKGLKVEHEFVRFGQMSTDYKGWEIDGLGAGRILRVSTNESHPIFDLHPDKSFWAMHNVAEAVAEVMKQEAKMDDVLKLKGAVLAQVGKIIATQIQNADRTASVEEE